MYLEILFKALLVEFARMKFITNGYCILRKAPYFRANSLHIPSLSVSFSSHETRYKANNVENEKTKFRKFENQNNWNSRARNLEYKPKKGVQNPGYSIFDIIIFF